MSRSKLKNDEELQWSAVVANNAMNRQRQAVGVNSYEKDIKLNPIQFISNALPNGDVNWLDLCCGEGNALIQTAGHFQKHPDRANIRLLGIDLVPYFRDFDPELAELLAFRVQNVSDWIPNEKYDLITIVHGLHYVGDKINLIIKCAGALKPNGILIGNLDMDSMLIAESKDSRQVLRNFFKQWEIHYNDRSKLIRLEGYRFMEHPFDYLGADDNSGPNYTGQHAVNSHYRMNADKL